jgi:hypothetical protein
MKQYRNLIIFLSGILWTYYCMSRWGLGMGNPVKYYLYAPVLLFSWLTVKECVRIRSNPALQEFTRSAGFVFTATLILSCITVVLFMQYEIHVFKTK